METRKNNIRNLVRNQSRHQYEVKMVQGDVPSSPSPSSTPSIPSTEAVVNDKDLNLDPKLYEKLDKVRNSRRGRYTPIAGTEKHPRATFIIPASMIRKLKYIALMETQMYSMLVREALQKRIDEYESSHGEIKFND